MRGVSLKRMRSVSAAAVAALVLWAPQGALAAGGSNGVHVDPGSPAGKQYAIPISSARGETSPPGPGSSGSANPPLFGAGITPSSSSSNAMRQAKARAAAKRLGTSHPGRRVHRRRAYAGATTQTVSTTPPPNSVTQANQVGSNTWLPLAIGGALVLLLGCGGGLVLRRRL
jgi:hypothetical protein